MPRAALNQIDRRATRFSAAVASAVLGLALVFGPVFGLPLIAIQTFVFAIAAVMGMQAEPYLVIYGKYIRPRRGTGVEPVADRPYRFSAALGMLLGCTALLAGVLSASILYYVVTGLAFAAAAVHAVTGTCLGCQWYNRIAESMAGPRNVEFDLTAEQATAQQSRTARRPEHDTLA